MGAEGKPLSTAAGEEIAKFFKQKGLEVIVNKPTSLVSMNIEIASPIAGLVDIFVNETVSHSALPGARGSLS